MLNNLKEFVAPISAVDVAAAFLHSNRIHIFVWIPAVIIFLAWFLLAAVVAVVVFLRGGGKAEAGGGG